MTSGGGVGRRGCTDGPPVIGGSIRSFNFDGDVGVASFVFVGAAHAYRWALGAQLPGGLALIIAGIPSVRERQHAKVRPNSTLSTPLLEGRTKT
jgi:hypothetical protein